MPLVIVHTHHCIAKFNMGHLLEFWWRQWRCRIADDLLQLVVVWFFLDIFEEIVAGFDLGRFAVVIYTFVNLPWVMS